MTSALYPLPLDRLCRQLVADIDGGGAIFGLPRSALWRPDPAADLSTTHFGQPMATPLGPASGPHTQLAQNIMLCWLSGARFIELKTVQILDRLEIPRPCIYVPHVGYNVEWSQELRVVESLEEYVKAWYLVHLAADRLGLAPDLVFDMSLGYDLKGVSSDTIAGFVHGLGDACGWIQNLRAELPPEVRIDVPTTVSRSVTLSTFHGCPADEIEAIATRCMRVYGLHTIVKLNPTLLGLDVATELLHDRLGYTDVALDPHAFDKDLSWSQLEDMMPRLQAVANETGRGLGVKFTNTLVCRAPDTPFAAAEMYLSGPPLHVLAATLAARFMGQFPSVPVSFSGGIDVGNFADVVATGIAPVTSATDLLKGKGYARLSGYLRDLEARMAKQGCAGLAEYVRGDVSAYAAGLPANPRYHQAQNRTPPRKVGTALHLLDCLTCDKCVPVCPNAAIFTYALPVGPLAGGRLRWAEGRFELGEGAPIEVSRRHQIGIVADLCNLCGQCDIVCPEDGGPFATKTNLFYNKSAWDEHPERDGLRFDGERLLWRRGGGVVRWVMSTDTLEVPGGTVRFEADAPVAVTGAGEVDRATVNLLRQLAKHLADAPWSPHAAAAASHAR